MENIDSFESYPIWELWFKSYCRENKGNHWCKIGASIFEILLDFDLVYANKLHCVKKKI